MDIQHVPASASSSAGFVRDSSAERELLTVVGDVDPLSEGEFRAALGTCLLGRSVIVDLRSCTSIGSLGVTALMRARGSSDRGFKVIASPGSMVHRVLEICNVEAPLGVFYDRGFDEV